MKHRYSAKALINNIIDEKVPRLLRGRLIRLLICIYIDAPPHEEIEYNRVVQPFTSQQSFINRIIEVSPDIGDENFSNLFKYLSNYI